MRVKVSSLCAVMVASALAGDALAGPPTRLRMIDQGYEDRDPLAISLRVLNRDLRDPQGFSQLFEDTANPGTYVRISGGTYLVSTQTEYAITEDDEIIAPTPGGAVYYIGGMPQPMSWEKPSDPGAPRGEAAPRALPVRRAPLAADVLLAQVAAPSAVRALDAERARRAVAMEIAAALVLEGLPDAQDLGEEEVRAARLREISERALRGG
jgi:hypothetical protein